MADKKKLTAKEQLELNRELKEVVEIMLEQSKQGIVTRNRYEGFSHLIEKGAKCRITKRLIESMFKYKFTDSCRLAKEERCGKRKDYKGIKYLLGDRNTAFDRLKETRPDLYEKGFEIVKTYLEKSMEIGRMDKRFSPVIHRKNDEGNYDFDNIEIMATYEHNNLTKKPQTLIMFTTKGIDITVIESIRALSQKLQISTNSINRNLSKFIQTENEKLIWFGNKQLNDMKKPFKSILRHCEQLKKEHDIDTLQYNSYDVLFEMLYSFGENIGIIKQKEQDEKKK